MGIRTEIGETMSGALQWFCKLVSRRHARAICNVIKLTNALENLIEIFLKKLDRSDQKCCADFVNTLT